MTDALMPTRSGSRTRRTHFVARHYLRGFTDPSAPSMIWVYTRGEAESYCRNISNVAIEKDFYPPEVEQELTHCVDTPGALALARVRERQDLDDEQKEFLSYYMAVQLMRVPQHRSSLDERMAAALKEVESELEGRIAGALDAQADQELVTNYREACQEVIDRWRASGVPTDLVMQFKEPWPFQSTVEAIRRMRWIFLVSSDPSSRFITSDNPVFHFTGLGLGKPNSEVSFPISSTVCLHGFYGSGPSWGYLPTRKQLVQEMNRRTVLGCTKYVYHESDSVWLQKLMTKRRLYTQQIRWTSR